MSSKNAYSYFVDDYVARKRKEGIIVPEKEKFQLAGPAWAKLSPKQKEVYQVKSKGGPREKFNSHGIPMEFIRNLQVEKELALSSENAEIEETIKTAQESNTLLKKTFYIVDTNFYCILNDGQHVTCEVAVVCFNLERGVRTNNYHCFIDVGSIPTGYGLNAKQNVKENGCPLPPVPGAEGDMLRILAELISFVDPAVNPIYTLPKKALQVESFFKQLYLCAGNSNEFKIYCLSRLFHKLRNVFTSSEDIGFPSQAIALAQLEKDPFTYTKGLGCQIHEEGDQFYCCALSVAKRWAFVICDFCCKPAGVSLKPGFHVPQKSYTGDFEVVQAAAARQQVSKASSSKAQEKIDYHYQEPVPFLNEAAIASPSYVAPVWERPQTAARAPPTPPVEASSPEEQWPSLGGGGLGGNPRRNKRGGRR